MTRFTEHEYHTITVQRSWVAENAAGATALVLDTQEAGPIAFSVTLEVIGVIRAELQKAEAVLRRTHGTA
jgi:hypothetical protein